MSIMVKNLKKKIVIFGSGFHAKVIFYALISNKKYNFLGFIDNRKIGSEVLIFKKKKYKIIDNLQKLKNLKKIKNISGIIGIG